jgi:signal transduction histidine kinase
MHTSIGTQALIASAEEASVEKAFAAEQYVSAVRLAIVVFNSLVYTFLLDQSQSIPWLAFVIIVVALVYSVYVYFFKPYRRFPVMLTSYFSTGTDALLITFWLYSTGGINSPFYVLWYVGIISIAFRYSMRETIMSALLYAACYVLLLTALGQVDGHLPDIVVRIGYIFLVCALGAQFAQEALLQIRAKLQLRDLAQRLETETKERQRAEQELLAREEERLQLAVEQERVKLLEQFISSMSHDLKTPLSVIYTNLYLLERSTDSEKQPQRLETIKSQTQHLERLIQDILTMSRLERDTEFSHRPFDLNRLLKTIHYNFVTRAEQGQLTLSLELDDSLSPVQGAEDVIHTALVNLVENAVSYTPGGGVITLRTYKNGAGTVAEVQDTGIGIDAEDLPHIFDQFYRADRARGAEKGGTGLGLAIAKKIVEIHGGTIKVESTPGQGSRFKMYFPVPVTVVN